MHNQFVTKKLTLHFLQCSFPKMKTFSDNDWPRSSVLIVWLAVIGSSQSILWF